MSLLRIENPSFSRPVTLPTFQVVENLTECNTNTNFLICNRVTLCSLMNGRTQHLRNIAKRLNMASGSAFQHDVTYCRTGIYINATNTKWLIRNEPYFRPKFPYYFLWASLHIPIAICAIFHYYLKKVDVYQCINKKRQPRKK